MDEPWAIHPIAVKLVYEAARAAVEKIDPKMHELTDLFASRVSARDGAELSRICEGIYGESD